MNIKNNVTTLHEEDHPEKVWFEQAAKQTTDTLADFVKSVMALPHDYGTVCHAVAACAMAAVYAADSQPNGGITGFQAGCVMWDVVKQMCFRNNQVGLRILDFDELLYPQYGYKFDKQISKSVWGKVQDTAKALLAADPHAHPAVIGHWKSIVDGEVPFGFTVKSEG